MLSKSQARLFFLGGTALFSLLFIGLTVDTLRKIPAQTRADQLTDEVKRGKYLWDRNNCMGCHTILGEGGYYAPELTRVYSRRGPQWIRLFIADTQAMFPGRRKMIQYDFSDEEVGDLIAFFRWVSEMDLNGFPADPPYAHLASGAAAGSGSPFATPAEALAAASGASPDQPPTVYQGLCLSCHSLGGRGGNVGPALDGIGSRMTLEELSRFIRTPDIVRPDTTMPRLPLSDEEIEELVSFLSDK